MSCLGARKCAVVNDVGDCADNVRSDNSEGVKSFLEKRPAKFSGTMDDTNVTGYPWWMPIDTLGRAKVDPSGKPKM
jgi:hypothetical protein